MTSGPSVLRRSTNALRRSTRGVSSFAALALLAAGTASAAPMEGGVTDYQPQAHRVVVCTVDKPFGCNLVRLLGSTRTLVAGTGKPGTLARGEFVSVEGSSQPGGAAARTITIHPDQMVRSIQGFKPAKAAHIEKTMRALPGVKRVKMIVVEDLGEIYLQFDQRRTTADGIVKEAAHKGVRLALPSAG